MIHLASMMMLGDLEILHGGDDDIWRGKMVNPSVVFRGVVVLMVCKQAHINQFICQSDSS